MAEKDNPTAQVEETFSNEELQKMLLDKQVELNESRADFLKLQTGFKALELRALKVYEENKMLKAAPEFAQQQAKMDFYLKMAHKFIASKAFKCETPEQAYVIMQAGSEMGMEPIEAMQALYIVNGKLDFYGDKMVARLTKKGYKIEYLNESKDSVTVRVFNEKEGFDVSETVNSNDQILQRSKAYGFAAKNKMRFHGLRLFKSFHLPHLFGSTTDEFTPDFTEWEEVEQGGHTALKVGNVGLLDQIKSFTELDKLEAFYQDNKAEITKNINLVSAVGAAKKTLSDG